MLEPKYWKTYTSPTQVPVKSAPSVLSSAGTSGEGLVARTSEVALKEGDMANLDVGVGAHAQQCGQIYVQGVEASRSR